MAPFSRKQWVLSHLILLGLLSLVALQFWRVANGQLKISFLDVGQGDAILIETPDFKNILIDAGPNSTLVDRLGETLGFFDKTIDLFISTHPDKDHFAGILDVLPKYKIQSVMRTGIVEEGVLYTAFLDEIKQQNIPVIVPTANQDIQIARNVYLDVIYPLQGQSLWGKKVDKKNDTSIVLRLRRLTDRGWENLAMLTGDAEFNEESEILLSGQDLEAGILKLGHHGSKTSTSPTFLKAVKPAIAIISAGENNTYGHPHAETMEKIKNLKTHSTAEEGTISMSL